MYEGTSAGGCQEVSSLSVRFPVLTHLFVMGQKGGLVVGSRQGLGRAPTDKARSRAPRSIQDFPSVYFLI